jgi:hypothetical protein
MEKFNLKKPNVVGKQEQYHVEVSNRFADLEDLDAEVTRDNIKIRVKGNLGYYELKMH